MHSHPQLPCTNVCFLNRGTPSIISDLKRWGVILAAHHSPRIPHHSIIPTTPITRPTHIPPDAQPTHYPYYLSVYPNHPMHSYLPSSAFQPPTARHTPHLRDASLNLVFAQNTIRIADGTLLPRVGVAASPPPPPSRPRHRDISPCRSNKCG